jgi:hypothetical protein
MQSNRDPSSNDRSESFSSLPTLYALSKLPGRAASCLKCNVMALGSHHDLRHLEHRHGRKLILSHGGSQSLLGHHYDLGVHYVPPARDDPVPSHRPVLSPDLEYPYLETFMYL